MMGATTGSELRIRDSVWTTGGWTFLVLLLLVGCTVSFVSSVSRSTTREEEVVVGIVVPGYAVPLQVVIPFRSSSGLVMVLPGRVFEPEDEALQLAAEESRVDEPELAIREIGPPRPFKDGWHNSSIVRRSGTGGSPFPLAAISKSFKRVGSTRDLLRIVSSRLSRGGKIFLVDE
nr:hypothetical protein [Tanacetum cinerariifolium]